MLLTTVVFDSSNPAWEKKKECTYKFLRDTEKYFNTVFDIRGYIYLNDIYEALAIDWDIKNNNLCIAKDNGVKYIKLELLGQNDGSILVHIHSCN